MLRSNTTTRALAAAALAILAFPLHAAATASLPDAAARFGARESVAQMRLSPDGSHVVYIAPGTGQGGTAMTLSLAPGATPIRSLSATGAPERLQGCAWTSAARLLCTIYGVVNSASVGEILPFSRLVAANAAGGNVRMVSTRQSFDSLGIQLYGGEVLDWLPDETDNILVVRNYVPEANAATRLVQKGEGLGVDRLNTASLKSTRVESPRDDAMTYLSDGRGAVRIMGLYAVAGATGQTTPISTYMFRRSGSRAWEKLSTWNGQSREGFLPIAVDHDLDAAYGFLKTDGRLALGRMKLDGSGQMETISARPDVDVDGLVRIGRRNRPIGSTYATDRREQKIFDADIARLLKGLTKAIPDQPLLQIVDSSTDERILLLWAGSDSDPGVYYILNRDTRELRTFLVVRPELEKVGLAKMKPVVFPAADGTSVPGYLTLPPGSDGRNLPALVLPHGGPSARDEWGFDWLAQFYAHMGYAVLQPNFRGSAGYGDAWFQENGFRAWKTAIGDVADAGRWMVQQGVADPKRLGIAGWSYGGYAALQAAATYPDLFHAVVAIAPVTDLATLKQEGRNWSDFRLRADFIGSGPHIVEGSPAQNAASLKAPVLLFHGDLDRNVGIAQSRRMAAALDKASKPNRLIVFEGLDHYLEDSAARTSMLDDSAKFLAENLK